MRNKNMIIIRGIHNFRLRSPNMCLSMGNFDGLHLGHRQLIEKMMQRASRIGGKGIVFTFNPHPRWILTPEAPTLLLTTLHEQVDLFSKWNLDVLLLARFNRTLAAMDPEQFVKNILLERLLIKEIFVGEGFTFGRNKSGTVALLDGLGKKYGFHVNQISLMRIDGEVVSSTLIRNRIQAGEIEQANHFLGHEYSLTGKVIKGSGRGWHMGYPTANLKVISKVLPPAGVYFVKIKKQGKFFYGLANLGSKPTFGKDAEMGVEAYILGINENLYGQKLTIYFQKRIREEIAFPTPQDLINQIKIDIQKVHQWITNHSA